MKKVLSFVLALVLCLGLCACSQKTITQQPAQQPAQQSGQQYVGGWQSYNSKEVILLPNGNAIYNALSCNLSDIAAEPSTLNGTHVAATWEYVDGYIIISYYRDGFGKVAVYKIMDERTISHDGEIYEKQW